MGIFLVEYRNENASFGLRNISSCAKFKYKYKKYIKDTSILKSNLNILNKLDKIK